jgi:hypothetical protein
MEETAVRPHHTRRQEHCTLRIYPNGTITDRGSLEKNTQPTATKRPRTKKKRGPVTEFSKASGSRLRRELAQTCGPDGGVCFGATLTVPGPNITIEEWRRLWKAFYCRVRRMDEAGLIWRIELQERGQPHIHCICWGRRKVVAARLKEHWLECLRILGPYEGPADIKFESSVTIGKDHGEFKPGWAKVTSREYWPGAYEHAVKIDGLDEKDDIKWWRYLAAHTSKSKQAQLGWKGRQWGKVNKAMLAHAKPTVIELPAKAMDKVIRYLKRLTHCHKASGHGRQTWFVSRETVMRLGEWAKREVSV